MLYFTPVKPYHERFRCRSHLRLSYYVLPLTRETQFHIHLKNVLNFTSICCDESKDTCSNSDYSACVCEHDLTGCYVSYQSCEYNFMFDVILTVHHR